MNDDEPRGENFTRRLLTLGLGAYFLTEDTVRRYVKDAKMPRDIARTITSNASKGKDELYGFVARELTEFLNKMDLSEELERLVRNNKVRISAEIEFLPKDGAARAAERQREDERAPEDRVADEERDGLEDDEDSRPDIEWSVRLKPSRASERDESGIEDELEDDLEDEHEPAGPEPDELEESAEQAR
jgi:hypothetical protein